MRKHTLPSVTPEQCEHITGMTEDHAAHTIHTTRTVPHGFRNVPVALCPGRHTPRAH